MVASQVLFGVDIENQIDAGQLNPICQVVDIPIFWNDPVIGEDAYSEANLIDLLNNFIPLNKDVRIYNMSFGNYVPITDFSFTPLANELDSLSKIYNVLFIIAAGNMRHNQPKNWADYATYIGCAESRINSPSESILALTVGSYSHVQNGNDIAPPNHLSPFSRVGPGADLGIKPDLVAPGGNCYVHRGAGLFRPESAAVGFDASGNSVAYNVGTSFSAPIVTHYAAKVLQDDKDISTNLLKCFLIHFASLDGFPISFSKPSNLYGFGEFQYADYFSSPRSAMLFIHEREIDSANYLHIPIHIPSTVDMSPNKRIKVKFTVVHDPDVNAANPAEYSLSDITFQLSKKHNSASSIVSGTNASLSKYTAKWMPIIKYERVFSRDFSSGGWELRLRLNTRGSLGAEYKQKFAVIIECIDETNSLDLYGDFFKEFGGSYSLATVKPSSAV